MEREMLAKIYENQIIANIKQKNLTAYEMAVLIDEYLTAQIAKGVKLEAIEQKLGITKRVLYKYRSILKLPKETIAQYKDTLSFEQMSIITYSLKDKSKVKDVMDDVVEHSIPSNKLLYKVAELNDKGKVIKHIIGEIYKLIEWAGELKPRVKALPIDKQKEVREAIEDLVNKLNEV